MKMKIRMRMARSREEREEREEREDTARAKRPRRDEDGEEEDGEDAGASAPRLLSENDAYTVMSLVLPYLMKPCVDVVTNAEVIARLRQPGQVAHIPASYANKVASSLDMFENFPFALDRGDVDKLLGGTVAMDTSGLMPIFRIGVNSIKVELLDFFAKNPQILEADHLPLLVSIAADRRHDAFVCASVCGLLREIAGERAELLTPANLRLMADTLVREATAAPAAAFGDEVQDYMGAKTDRGGAGAGAPNPTLVGMSVNGGGAAPAAARTSAIFVTAAAVLRASRGRMGPEARRAVAADALPLVLAARGTACASARSHLCRRDGLIAAFGDELSDAEVQGLVALVSNGSEDAAVRAAVSGLLLSGGFAARLRDEHVRALGTFLRDQVLAAA